MTEQELRYNFSLRLYFEGKAFGPGLAALLHGVDETSSLQKAAASMDMAYSKAWKILKNAEEVWGLKLTDREIGGKNGGGSVLTREGRLLLEAYDGFVTESREELDRIFEKHFDSRWLEGLRAGCKEEKEA